MERESPTRRSFLGKLLAGTLLTGTGAFISSILAYLHPPKGITSTLSPELVRVARVADIPLGKGKLSLVGGEPVWILHLARGFVGLSAHCTHKGCIVRWEEKKRILSCPCHDGHFDVNGNVTFGLPRKPLAVFRVGQLRDELYVTRTKERKI
jgi:cytochrome b6-f complex iron-sulfur subunit